MMPMTPYKPRLVLHVIWSASFPLGDVLANHIYSRLCRDISHPVSRGIGIPIYFHTGATPAAAGLPDGIMPDTAQSSVVITLVDDSIRGNDEWILCVDALAAKIETAGHSHLFLPVACDDRAHMISAKATGYNFIRLDRLSDDLMPERLVAALTHELARLLIGKNVDVVLDDARRLDKSLAPVKLFISHAKSDGLDIALQLKRHVEDKLPAARFFDSNDNAFGRRFGEEIEANVAESALIVIHSDRYSSREWCRREVLLAKRYGCPIIVVNAIKSGEDRSFPYLGNVPTIRWLPRSKTRSQSVVDLALREVLRNVYFTEHVKSLKTAGFLDHTITLANAPEVLTYLQARAQQTAATNDMVLLYPDPPLGTEEVQVLGLLDALPPITTPTSISARKAGHAFPLKDRVIGLSISNSPDLRHRAMSLEHLRDASVEFARHLLAQGATVAYGGDLRGDGFTRVLFELVRVHNEPTGKPRERILNFLSWPLYCGITPSERADLNEDAILREIPPPDDLGVDCSRPVAPDTTEHRYIWARCLTAMRKEMTRDIRARILVGGQVTDFKGRYPGLLEEALLAMRSGMPLYLAGGFGGVTRLIADALTGTTPPQLTLAEQEKDFAYRELVPYYNTRATEDLIDYEGDLRFLRERGLNGLNNGLSAAENRQLFQTSNLPEMIYLILRGLTTVCP